MEHDGREAGEQMLLEAGQPDRGLPGEQGNAYHAPPRVGVKPNPSRYEWLRGWL